MPVRFRVVRYAEMSTSVTARPGSGGLSGHNWNRPASRLNSESLSETVRNVSVLIELAILVVLVAVVIWALNPRVPPKK